MVTCSVRGCSCPAAYLIEERGATVIAASDVHGPPTPDADEIRIDRNVIIPDVLCYADGVNVSYFELTQGLRSFFLTEDKINERLRQIIVCGFYLGIPGRSHTTRG